MALSEEKLKDLPQPAQDFWRKAFAFPKTDWFLMAADSQQFKSWRGYFNYQGWEPFAMKQVRLDRIKKIVMPAEWPEWFDQDYRPYSKRVAAE